MPVIAAAQCRVSAFVVPVLLLAASAVRVQPVEQRFESRKLSPFDSANPELQLREEL